MNARSQTQFNSCGRQAGGAPIGNSTRVILIAWAMFLIGGFTVARSLDPDPRGFGTHQQLGLPACSVRMIFSRPCPGCGMTTCFAQFVRGNLVSAARANPAGVLLALVCALMIPWSVVSAMQGRLWMIDEPIPALTWIIGVIGAMALLSWAMVMYRTGWSWP